MPDTTADGKFIDAKGTGVGASNWKLLALPTTAADSVFVAGKGVRAGGSNWKLLPHTKSDGACVAGKGAGVGASNWKLLALPTTAADGLFVAAKGVGGAKWNLSPVSSAISGIDVTFATRTAVGSENRNPPGDPPVCVFGASNSKARASPVVYICSSGVYTPVFPLCTAVAGAKIAHVAARVVSELWCVGSVRGEHWESERDAWCGAFTWRTVVG